MAYNTSPGIRPRPHAYPQSAPATEHQRLPVHDIPDLLIVNGLDASDFSARFIDRLEAGGVGVCLVSSSSGWKGLFDSLDSPHHRVIHENAHRVGLARSVADIERLRASGRIAIVLGLQVPDMIEEDAGRLVGLHAMGLRSCGLSYNTGNYIGSGCVELEQGPLTRFGVRVVETLQEFRVVVDIAGHCSEATGFDALRHTKGPVVCSHTTARALRDNPRSTSDAMLDAIADRGGVIGIAAFSFFLVPHGRGTVDDYVRHVDYVARRVGADHVGIGLDFILDRERTGPMTNQAMFPPQAYPQTYDEWVYPVGLSDFTGLRGVATRLLELGHSESDVRKIMGGNWLRVWREVWGA